MTLPKRSPFPDLSVVLFFLNRGAFLAVGLYFGFNTYTIVQACRRSDSFLSRLSCKVGSVQKCLAPSCSYRSLRLPLRWHRDLETPLVHSPTLSDSCSYFFSVASLLESLDVCIYLASTYSVTLSFLRLVLLSEVMTPLPVLAIVEAAQMPPRIC